jgi:hypothetical protein
MRVESVQWRDVHDGRRRKNGEREGKKPTGEVQEMLRSSARGLETLTLAHSVFESQMVRHRRL